MKYLSNYGNDCLDKTLGEIILKDFPRSSLEELFDYIPDHRKDLDYLKKLGKRKLRGLVNTFIEVDGQVNTSATKIEYIGQVVEMLATANVLDVYRLEDAHPKLVAKLKCLLRATKFSDTISGFYVVHYEGEAKMVARHLFRQECPNALSGHWEKRGQRIKAYEKG